MIKYLGSKRTLVPQLCELVLGLRAKSAIDLFSGTARVGHALKRLGIQVHANDHNAYAATLARCYVETDRNLVLRNARLLIAELNKLRGETGWFTENFCINSRFFQPKNGARIDAIREAIARKELDQPLESVLLVALMEAADRVDSTIGVQMAYLKHWAPRSFNDLELRLPDVLPRARNGKGSVHQLDALDAAQVLTGDVAYLDPPYNQHKYLGNYHIWESLILWDKPEVYGVACKRIDCRSRLSSFNSRLLAVDAMRSVVSCLQCEHLIVSFSDEGYLSRRELEEILRCRGKVLVLGHDYKRHVGAQLEYTTRRGKRLAPWADCEIRNISTS
ncbi:DNA adenine methylase [Nannocystis pusilla]|uniref:DNA adenine methylase n=1 Tax=Nannocystis pusilla TaxID=889268 RepID=UPI003B832893